VIQDIAADWAIGGAETIARVRIDPHFAKPIGCWHFPNSFSFGKNSIDVDLANQLRFRKLYFQKERFR
jgi:hypothetical protein